MSRRVLLGSVLSASCAITIGAFGACGSLISSVQPRAAGPGAAPASRNVFGAGRFGTDADSGLLGRPRDRANRGANAGGELAQRRQCRTSSIPSGWIAVAYEGSSSECPGRGTTLADSSATIAVIVHYAGAPIGTRLDVCVDQSTPYGWNPVTDEGTSDPGACPRAAARDHDTVRRIRRDY